MKDFLDFLSSMQLGLIAPCSDLLGNNLLMSFMIFYTLALLITIIIETDPQENIENIENDYISTFIEGGIRTLGTSSILSFVLFIFVVFLVVIIDASLVFLSILTIIFGVLGFIYFMKYIIRSIKSGM